MKQFLLFAYDTYEPNGGWNDFVQDFDTAQEAVDYLTKITELKQNEGSVDEQRLFNRDWVQLVDHQHGPVVSNDIRGAMVFKKGHPRGHFGDYKQFAQGPVAAGEPQPFKPKYFVHVEFLEGTHREPLQFALVDTPNVDALIDSLNYVQFYQLTEEKKTVPLFLVRRLRALTELKILHEDIVSTKLLFQEAIAGRQKPWSEDDELAFLEDRMVAHLLKHNYQGMFSNIVHRL